MRIVLLTAAAALSACSPEPGGTNQLEPGPFQNSAPVAAPAPAAPPPTTGAVVQPGELKTFADWTVGCDNTVLCTMASLGAEGSEFPAVTMAVLRQPGPAGAFDLSFAVAGDGPAVQPVAVLVDDRRLALPDLSGASAATVARAMADGRVLTVVEAGDRRRARLSLAGASAALRWIDAQQGRAGTVTAAVTTGPAPASGVPERRSAPVVRAMVATGTAARPTAAQLAAMRKQAACDGAPSDSALWQPEMHALGGGATLVLLPCSTGAYNLSSALFVLRDGRVMPAQTDAPTGFGPTPAAGLDRLASVVNGSWHEGELTSLAKGRGLGDCGVAQTMVWDGTRLRLTEQSEMGECRGNTNYITTWRTQVVRG